MFCIHCGKKIPDKSEFCPFCGTPIVQETNQNISSSNQKENNQKGKIVSPSNNNHKKSGLTGIHILGIIIIVILVSIRGCMYYGDLEHYDKGLSQLENKKYRDAAVSFVGITVKDGHELGALADAFRSFKEGDYEMADYYLKDLNLSDIEKDHPSLKDDIEAMKTKLDSTREQRKQAQHEKYEKEEAQKKAESDKQAQEYLKTLHIGDPDNKIVDVMGTPKGKNTTQVDGHTMVQWVYDNAYIYTEDGIITSFQKFQ